jgi:hypothetical protein
MKMREKIQKILDQSPFTTPVILKSESLNIYRKMLVPDDMTLIHFMIYIRKIYQIAENEGLYLFIDNKLQVPTKTMRELYAVYKNDDFILIIYIEKEKTFG